jgi:Na+(H+)/acetate symporter ActP
MKREPDNLGWAAFALAMACVLGLIVYLMYWMGTG